MVRNSLPGKCVLLAFGLVFSVRAFSEQSVLVIHVINAKNAAAFSNLTLTVILYRYKGAEGTIVTTSKGPAVVIQNLKEATDKDGEIRVFLPNPQPDLIEIDSALGCGSGLFEVETILKDGVVGENFCRGKVAKDKLEFRTHPSEVFLFARPYGFWDNVFH
jgi:hypothetical protein